MAFTTKLCTREYDAADGSVPEGIVYFTPAAVMVNGPTVAAKRLQAPLDFEGKIAINLYANTDPATWPPDTYYWVEEQITGAPPRRYSITIPHTGGSTIDLATLDEIESPPPLTYPSPGPTGPAGANAVVPDVQVFEANGTWTKPAGTRTVTTVIGIAAGGGGGSGPRRASGTATSGGGAGGSAGSFHLTIPTDQLGATEPVTVPGVAAGGVARTTNDQDGAVGSGGLPVVFGSAGTGGVRARANGGSGGAAGGTGAAAGGSLGRGPMAGKTGGAGAVGAAGTAGGFGDSTSSGGGAGGVSTTPTAFAGGLGGNAVMVGDGSAAGGTVPGGAGATGVGVTTPPARPQQGGGGGGGAASITGAAGNGGDGGKYGGSGGGGGASLNGSNSGKGGDGAPGLLIAYTW